MNDWDRLESEHYKHFDPYDDDDSLNEFEYHCDSCGTDWDNKDSGSIACCPVCGEEV